jgi:Flp pilus assembly protein CpaB
LLVAVGLKLHPRDVIDVCGLLFAKVVIMKSKSFVLMIVSLGFGLVAAIGISQVMGRNNGGAAPEIPKRPVLVASADLEHNSRLTEENVRVEEWPVEIVPENTAESIEQIKQMVCRQALGKGMPINLSTLVHEKNVDQISIPNGCAVISIKVSAEDTIYGMLRPGDKVNMIGHIRGKPAKTFLRGLRVFSVDANMTAKGVSREEGGAGGDAVVGILANERQSEMIMQVQKEGAIKLVLRGDHVQTEEENALDEEGMRGLGLFGEEIAETPQIPTPSTPVTTDIRPLMDPPKTTKTMKVWTQEGMELVTFRDGVAVTPGPIDRHRSKSVKVSEEDEGRDDGKKSSKSPKSEESEESSSGSKSKFDDDGDSEASNEYERGLEEDQY